MNRILVTGACGQIGSELVVALKKQFGSEKVIYSDIKKPGPALAGQEGFIYLDVLDYDRMAEIVVEYQVDVIFHMAAILSASGEQKPKITYRVNLDGLMNVLEVARKKGVKKVITPSSIAVYGPDAPKENTPEHTPLNPTTMYGVTKVAGEKLLQYYCFKYGIDTRSLRYPGIISSETAPGGGTTDFAVDMYVHAVQEQPYECFVDKDTILPFMYMPDAVQAIIQLAFAPAEKLRQRVFNVHALSLTPAQITESIRKYIPSFRITYRPDFRQAIANSWPHSLDDRLAREQWGWYPRFDLDSMTRDMIAHLRQRIEKR